jgi:hypothetical protein
VKFQKSTIRIAWGDGTRPEVSCVEAGGLAVHKDPSGIYVVSHIASGKAVQRFLKARNARAFVLESLKLRDWTVDEATISQWLFTAENIDAVVALGQQHGSIR